MSHSTDHTPLKNGETAAQQQTEQSKEEATNDVEKKLTAGEYKLKENIGAKSDVWPRFSVVTDANGNERGFAIVARTAIKCYDR